MSRQQKPCPDCGSAISDAATACDCGWIYRPRGEGAKAKIACNKCGFTGKGLAPLGQNYYCAAHYTDAQIRAGALPPITERIYRQAGQLPPGYGAAKQQLQARRAAADASKRRAIEANAEHAREIASKFGTSASGTMSQAAFAALHGEGPL
jgi:hypothetical protein